jgi:hypothetical protein
MRAARASDVGVRTQSLVKYQEEHVTPLLKSFAAIGADYLARIACDNSGSRC